MSSPPRLKRTLSPLWAYLLRMVLAVTNPASITHTKAGRLKSSSWSASRTAPCATQVSTSGVARKTIRPLRAN
ncbi:major fimbrial subunit [Escherichia phage IMM-002]|uniref:Major fimbrial subunit n=1 Tax=Escherichia phage IMM-002 TaxID=2041760 RepID=A0A384WW54_9CAUD|nr:major fimbrial subunit [Escherichia phage IMM-002]ATI16980.1 major fimbrial subunit [Escherichia phage IMM-002]